METSQNRQNLALKLTNECYQGDDGTDQINVQFTSTNINFSFHQLIKYSQYFQNTYLYNAIVNEIVKKLQEIEKKYQISNNHIEMFFKLIEDEEVNITNEDYFDLYKISDILKVNSLRTCLQKYAKDHSSDIDFLITLMLLKNQTSNEFEEIFNDNLSIDIEEILIENIDKCILNKKFGKLQISTIYRIIENSKKDIKLNELLFNFIIESLKERCTLFKFIELQLLSDEKFDELYNYYVDGNLFYQYLPIDLKYTKSLREDKKSLEKQIQSQQNLFLNDISNYKSKIRKLEQEKNELQEKINKITTDFENTQTKMKNEFHEEIMKITERNNKLKAQLNEICEEKNKQKSDIEKLIQYHYFFMKLLN